MSGLAAIRLATLLMSSLFIADSSAAQEANRVFLDVIYLGTPTDWCPADAGVPAIVKMDGPNIIEEPKALLKSIKVNKGGKTTITYTSDQLVSLGIPQDVVDPNSRVIGRFSAEFQTCNGIWNQLHFTGAWSLTAINGSVLTSGTFEDRLNSSFEFPPFFEIIDGYSEARYAKLSDQLLFALGPVETKITQTFAAEPDKE